MRKLRSDDSPALTLTSLRFLTIRVRSRPASAALASDIVAARTALRGAVDIYDEAREDRMAATAEVQYRDSVVDRAVMDLSREAAVPVGGKQDDPRFRKLFPSAPNVAMRPVGGEAQGRFVLGVLDALQTDPAYKSFAGHAKKIRAALDALDEAEDRRRDAFVTEARARTEVVAATAAAQRTHNGAYHQVALKFPDDDALVESFFLSTSASVAAAEATDPPVEPTPTDGSDTPAAKSKRQS